MTELSFAKSFLQTLDSRPNKILADHVEDPRSYPARSAYILPKMLKPPTKRQKITPGAERNITASLKSLRNPPLNVTLRSLSPNTSILEIKNEVEAQTSYPASKLRVLHNKKPLSDSKVLKDVVEEGDDKVEFSLMVIGGAAAVRRTEEIEVGPQVATGGVSGREVLGTEAFWGDLNGFLMQRVRDEGEAVRVWTVFKEAWEKGGG